MWVCVGWTCCLQTMDNFYISRSYFSLLSNPPITPYWLQFGIVQRLPALFQTVMRCQLSHVVASRCDFPELSCQLQPLPHVCGSGLNYRHNNHSFSTVCQRVIYIVLQWVGLLVPGSYAGNTGGWAEPFWRVTHFFFAVHYAPTVPADVLGCRFIHYPLH